MKLQLLYSMLFFTAVVFSISTFHYMFCQAAYTTMCFPIIVHNSTVKVNLNFNLYVSKHSHPVIDGSLPNDTFVSVMFYRKKEIELGKKFLSDYNELGICNDDAIAEGYCEQKHYRKLLYNYKDPESSQGHVLSHVLTELGTYKSIASVDESGIYCLKAYSPDSKLSRIVVEQIDPSKNFPEETRQILEGLTIKLLFFFFPSLLFIIRWNQWAAKNQATIPFFIKSLIITLILKLTTYTLQIYHILSGYLPLFVNSTISRRYLVPWMSYIMGFEPCLTFEIFLLLQYCNQFTFEKITPIKFKKLLGFRFCIQFFSLLLTLLGLYMPSFDIESWLTLKNIFLPFLLRFSEVLSFTIIIWKHGKAAREYRDLNKTTDPTFRSFRLWIYSTAFYDLLAPVQPLLAILVDFTIRWIPYVRSHYVIDGVYGDFNISMSILMSVITVIIQFLPLLNFLPSSYERARDYHFMLE